MRSATARVAPFMRHLALAAVLLCLVVVVLGGYVRLTAAGLGCPDWPGCYGHLTPIGAQENPARHAAFPNSPLDIGKAWREMIHRYAASTLGLIIVVIAAFSLVARRSGSGVSTPFALLLLATVIFQGLLGMLTVTWQLKPLIVTLHLVFGLTTLGLLWWLWLSLRASAHFGQLRAASATKFGDATRAAHRTRRWVMAALILLGLQIALGGWTSSNYAAVACPDFPRCQNEWWPDTDYRDAFVVWRGLGINYEGGVLDHPARVAIHFTHRLGATLTASVLLLAALGVLRRRTLRHANFAAAALIAALALQLLVGISMVVLGFPLWLAAAHNAGAALLVLATVALYQRLRVC